MYYSYKVDTLSPAQIRKLIKGEKVKLRKGSHHTVHLTEPQIKKIETAHKKAMASVVQLDPHQASQHGEGLMGDLKKFVVKQAHLLNPVVRGAKTAAHSLVSKGSKYAHNKIDEFKEFEGGRVKPRIYKKKVARGKGIGANILKGLATGADLLGFGVKPRIYKKKTTRGKGFLGDLAKAGAKSAATFALDKGADYLKSKVSGMGVKRRVGRPCKSRRGSSLMPAGY